MAQNCTVFLRRGVHQQVDTSCYCAVVIALQQQHEKGFSHQRVRRCNVFDRDCLFVSPKVVLHLPASNTNARILLHQITTTYSGACIEGAILAKCLLSTNLFALEDC